MNIGIIGFGFVGQAIYNYLKTINTINIFIYDKYKNISGITNIDIVFKTNIIYICLPTEYNDELKTYDMSIIDTTIEQLSKNNYTGVILIKSTILPLYCSELNNKYKNLSIIHNPEFLSARTASEDFANQSHIILGYTEQSKNVINLVERFYELIFPSALMSIVTSDESALIKIGCNSFYATKIQYFTEIYLLCEKLNISYGIVKDTMLKNNWINPMHTCIPGHDNMLSFGGACLPKDISSLNQLLIKNNINNKVINSVITERNEMRSL
jgi:UDPglucose 6-dehydrogenase